MSTLFKNPSNRTQTTSGRGNIFFVLFFLFGIGLGFGQINVQFSQATGSDVEANGGNLPELIVSGGVLGADTSVTVTDDGTGSAVSGTDYSFSNPQIVVIPAADYTSPTNIPITGLSITEDSDVEPDEDIDFSLSTSDGTLTLGPQTTTTYTINNDDSVTVEFSQATGAAAENVGNNLPSLFITGTVANTSSVTITGGGSATPGTDYTLTSPQAVNIPAGSYDGTAGTAIAIPTLGITGDAVLEPNETINLTLSAPVGDVTLGGQTTTTYTITNDDTAAIIIADTDGNEDDGAISVVATLNNAVQGTGFSVQVSTSNGTATIADLDYTQVSGLTLNFVGNAGETQNFNVLPTADAIIEVNETVSVSMSNLTGTALGVNILDTATITINNDDSCRAGTTAPALDGSVFTAFCDVFNQDLDLYISNAAPVGSELRWSTISDISVTADYLGGSVVSAPGTYYGFFYDALNDCFSNATPVTLTQSFTPTTGVASNLGTCSDSGNGDTLVDLDDSLTGADPGTWVLTTAPVGASISINGSNIVDFDGQPQGDYIFTFTTTGAQGTCANQSVDVTVTVNDCSGPCDAGNTAPQFNGDNTTIEFCDVVNTDLNDYLTSTTAPSGTVLIWSTSNDPTVTGAHLNGGAVVEPGTYYGFFYDETNDCASPILPITLVRNFTPTIDSTTGDAGCGASILTLSATASVTDDSNISYTWYDAPTGGNIVGTSDTFTTNTLSETTSFYVTASANGCETERVEVVATINAAPNAGTPTNAVACNVVGDGGPNSIDLDDRLAGADSGTWTIIADPSNGTLVIGSGNTVDFVGLPSGNYIFEYTTNTAEAPCTDPSVQVTISVSDCVVDSDGDGLSDGEEATLGTNPDNPDTDGDGLTDGEEVLVIDDISTTAVPENATDPLDACDPFLTPDCNPEDIDLAITKELQESGPYLEGDQAVFVITVSNNDMTRVLDIVVTDVLDPSFQYESHQASMGNYDPNTGEWSIAEMTASDAEATLEISVTVTESAVLQNTATLTSSFPADNTITENNTSTVTINEDIDLGIAKTVEDNRSKLIGGEVTFEITVSNNNLTRVLDVIVSDVLSSSFTYSSHNASLGDYDPGTGEWSIPEMAANVEEAILTITATINDLEDLENTATLISSFPADATITENNSDTVTVNAERSQCEDPGTICNIFSPNGDGWNDTLTLVGHEQYPNNTFEVFDRYGNSVFQMDGYDSSWDGTGKNGQLPKGTYFYILDLNGDGTDVVKGWIQIVRNN